MDFSDDGYFMPGFSTEFATHVPGTTLTALAVPAFDDNYLWLVHDGKHAIAIDPGDAGPILAVLNEKTLTLSAILLTHHHADHVGGVPVLLQSSRVPVYGPRREAITGVTNMLTEGDQIVIPALDLRMSVLDVPGHTLGHIAYVAREQRWLFCGDTLFAGGCGRLFEGSPAQMASSLAKLMDLPNDTKVFCAHEYTLENLRFAQEVEPENAALSARMASEREKRAVGMPTIPSSIGLEKSTNPFLRYREPAIMARLMVAGRLTDADLAVNPFAAFAALREWKNTYR